MSHHNISWNIAIRTYMIPESLKLAVWYIAGYSFYLVERDKFLIWLTITSGWCLNRNTAPHHKAGLTLRRASGR